MTNNRATSLSFLFLTGFCSLPSPTSAQVFTDVLDGAGNEVYTGVNGFGAFNWVSALNFGFSTQHGSNAFLSNLTGQPIPDIGMVKPFSTTMGATTYRVAFYCSRYSSPNTLAYSDYDTLYIGSPAGTMVWDTVPTPITDFQWVRWSGLYTPAPADIGQPFKFGFSITLNNGTSFALDGPVTATDISTGIITRLDAPDILTAFMDPARSSLVVRSADPMETMELVDVHGRTTARTQVAAATSVTTDISALSAGLYVVRAYTLNGHMLCGRVVLP
ncbi:MAG: hypothetical protein WAU70_12400 [Flavobacteriales bacterium]